MGIGANFDKGGDDMPSMLVGNLPEVGRFKGTTYALAISYINNFINIRKDFGLSNGQVSDGYHTFNELYDHRAKLFASLCATQPENCFKSLHHEDGSMFDNMFIVGIKTDEGYATYHYDIDPYWDMFHVQEVETAPPFDGHTPADAINRILNHFNK